MLLSAARAKLGSHRKSLKTSDIAPVRAPNMASSRWILAIGWLGILEKHASRLCALTTPAVVRVVSEIGVDRVSSDELLENRKNKGHI